MNSTTVTILLGILFFLLSKNSAPSTAGTSSTAANNNNNNATTNTLLSSLLKSITGSTSGGTGAVGQGAANPSGVGTATGVGGLSSLLTGIQTTDAAAANGGLTLTQTPDTSLIAMVPTTPDPNIFTSNVYTPTTTVATDDGDPSTSGDSAGDDSGD